MNSAPSNRQCLLALALALAPTSVAQLSVVGRHNLNPFFNAAATQRVDVVMIGDSNQVSGKEGWDRGITVALTDHFPLYATGLHSSGENDGKLFSIGYLASTFGTAGIVAHQGAPLWADRPMPFDPGIFPNNYIYVPAGQVLEWWKDTGLLVMEPSPIDISGPIRFHLVYATFSAHEPGSFRPCIRTVNPPEQIAVSDPISTTKSGKAGVATMSLDAEPGPRSMLWFRYNPAQTVETQHIDGPFVAYYHRAENTSRPIGASAHTLLGKPGLTARDMAQVLQQAPDEQLSLYFSQVRALQGPVKRVLLRVNTGANDLNEKEPSLGPKKVPQGNSPPAFADNVQAIIDRVAGIWTLNAWDPSELFFNIAITHPIASPDHPLLVGYRDACDAVALANPRAAVTRFDALTSYDELQALSWYSSPTDPLHLSLSGYEGLSRRELLALLACPADFDENNSLDIDDFVAFQAYYAVGSAAADLNDDAELNIDDFILMQVLYALGCE